MKNKCIEFMKEKHKGQFRKYTNEPYFVHPLSVSKIVEDVLFKHHINDINHPMILASLLHDTVEDTNTTYVEIEKEFGITVSNLVYWLTNVSKPTDGVRKIRKQMDLQHILHAPIQAIIIKMADVIDNCSNIVERDPEFAKRYLKEKNTFIKALYKLKKEKFDIHWDNLTLYQKCIKKCFDEMYKNTQDVINKELNKLKEYENEFE